MSSDSGPSDPFGRGERTVVRPNPGGRRPAAPPPQNIPTPVPQPVNPAFTRGAPPTAPGQPRGGDEWTGQAPEPAPPEPTPQGGRALVLKRDVPVASNANVLLQAAGPILMLLGRLRVALARARFGQLMEQVADAIQGFEKDVRGRGVSEDQARVAKYALCATADDIVQNIPSEERHMWAQYSMLSRFFGERVGGVRFFEELERALKDPVVNYDLLELHHACLAVGFQGVHRTTPAGQATLQQTQRNLYETLRRVRAATNDDLSPRWRGQELPVQRQTLRIPFWAVGALAMAILAAFYIALRLLLSGNSEAVANQILALTPEDPVTIERRAPVRPPPPPPPPPTSTQLERIRAGLAAEIRAGQLSADQNATHIVVRIGAFALFASGQATVLDQYRALAEKVADVLGRERGRIRIVGHTDSQPIRDRSRFPDNFALSVARAQAVATIMRARIPGPDRVDVEGRGADVPIASNASAEGQARNRRVEVYIERER